MNDFDLPIKNGDKIRALYTGDEAILISEPKFSDCGCYIVADVQILKDNQTYNTKEGDIINEFILFEYGYDVYDKLP
jgi:hypothetical protein